jgi:hypothetical protein
MRVAWKGRVTCFIGIALGCSSGSSGSGEPAQAELKLSCGKIPILGNCECSLGGEPYHSYSDEVSGCSPYDFEPAGLCCVSANKYPYATCECHAVGCTEGTDSCVCNTMPAPYEGTTSCTPGKWLNCCKTNADCACKNEACNVMETPVANCTVLELSCNGGEQITTCSADAIEAAKNE